MKDELAAIEALAVELARLAGAEIATALGRTLTVRYKGGEAGGEDWRDPVSQVDHAVEQLLRARLADRFPGHGAIGEEMDPREAPDSDWLWAIDPIDGTVNFINGFPLFAASVGVLHRGRPVVGALWCSTSHALRAGTYHACLDGALRFDEEEIPSAGRDWVRRPLAGMPEARRAGDLPWDIRKTGSAALECAFVAAGLLRVARFDSPNLWDVAGGIPLVLATGGEVREWSGDGWRRFEGFDSAGWRRPLAIGEPAAVARMCDAPFDR